MENKSNLKLQKLNLEPQKQLTEEELMEITGGGFFSFMKNWWNSFVNYNGSVRT